MALSIDDVIAFVKGYRGSKGIADDVALNNDQIVEFINDIAFYFGFVMFHG